MKRKGYSFSSPAPDKARIRRDGLSLAYDTELADTHFRRTEGYGVTGGLVGLRSREEAPHRFAPQMKGMSAAQQETFLEDWSTCDDEATKKVMRQPGLDALLDASSGLSGRVESDPRLAAARAQWRRCMAGKGYQVQDSHDPSRAIEEKARPMYEAPTWDKAAAKRLHAQELKVAEVDWVCRSTTITPTLQKVRNEVEGAFVEANPELVAKARAEMKALIGQ